MVLKSLMVNDHVVHLCPQHIEKIIIQDWWLIENKDNNSRSVMKKKL